MCPLQSFVISLLISLVSTLLFSRTGGVLTVSSKIFDAAVPLISTEKLVLPRHVRCVLSRLRCNGHSLLLSSFLSRNGRIKSPSCSACGHLTSHFALSSYRLCAAHSLATFCLSMTSGPGPGELTGFWGSMVFRHASISRKGSGNNNTSLNAMWLFYNRQIFFRDRKINFDLLTEPVYYISLSPLAIAYI